LSLTVFLAVLAAAALHAGWNAVVKLRVEPLLAIVLINGSCAVLGVFVLMFTGFPASDSWGWLALSGVVHLLYGLALAEAYRFGDMGFVYPVARGAAPLMTLLGSLLFVGDPLPGLAIIGILVLGFGIALMALSRASAVDGRALIFALLTACTIALYTLSDGLGARASGNPHAYAAAMFVLDGGFLLAYTLLTRGWSWLSQARVALVPGMAGGVMGFAAYWIVIWAMTVAPIALVAALRESSILFATLIAVFILKEKMRPLRLIGACVIVMGIVLMRVGTLL
jgi:drug/metabolite transporter (DMT)-like permease